MSYEALLELRQIKWLLAALVFLFLLLIVVLVLGMRALGRAQRNSSVIFEKNNFIGEMQRLEASGKYDEMIEKAGARSLTYPNEPEPYWYLSNAYYRKGEYGVALDKIAQLKAGDPIWFREGSDEYVEEIQGLMKGPTRDGV